MKKVILMAAIGAALSSCCEQQGNTTPVEINKQKVVVENILSRRSIRDYTDQQVTKEQLETIIQCGINAPSAKNLQPWQVRVVQNQEILNKIREVNAGTIYNAPTVIFIAQDKGNKFKGFESGLITENILLAAESMDLGTCVVGSVTSVLNAPEGKEILGSLDLPENYEVIVGICLGYKNEYPKAQPRNTENVKYID